MKTRLISIAALFLIVVMFAAGCTSGEAPPAQEQEAEVTGGSLGMSLQGRRKASSADGLRPPPETPVHVKRQRIEQAEHGQCG